MKEKIKQNHKVTIFAILLSLISIGVLVFGFIIVSSDKVVMLQSISNLYNKISKNFNEDSTLIDKISTSDKIGIRGDITIGKDNTIIYNYLENKTNKKSSLDLLVNNQEETLLDSNFSLDNNKLYMFLNNITPNYYYQDFDYIYFIRSLTGNDYEDLVKIIKEAFDSAISNKNIKKEKVTITYNNKDKKVNKLTYTFTNEKLAKVLTNLSTNIKNNKKLYSDIRNFFDISKSDFNKIIDSYKKELLKDKNKEIFSYSTYYYGFNKIVMYDLYLNESKALISYKEEKDTDTIRIDIDGNNKFDLVSKEENNKKTFSGSIKDLSIDIDLGEYYNYSDTKDIEFNGTYEDGKLDLKLDDLYHLVLSRKNVDNNSFNYKTSIKLSSIEDKEEKEIFNIKVTTEYYFDTDVEKIEEEAKNINEIEDEEKNQLEENIKNSKLYKLLFNEEED